VLAYSQTYVRPLILCFKLCELDYKNHIFGGDLNTDFARFHPMRSCIIDFFSDLGLRLSDELLPFDSVTFHADTTGASSFIDHFAKVTQQLYVNVLSSDN